MTTDPVTAREFKVRACVDWVKLRVQLARASEGGKLRTRLHSMFGVSHAAPLYKGAGNAATEFELTVQAPKSMLALVALRAFLEQEYGLRSGPTITGIEIAIDWSHRTNDLRSLHAQTLQLMHSVMPPVSNNPRMSKHSRDNDCYLLPHRRGLEIDKTLYIGNDGDDLFWRAYFKCTDDIWEGDHQEREARKLDPKDYRARIEVRIKGEKLLALGLSSLADLKGYKFERLQGARLFRFGRFLASDMPMYANVFSATAMAAHHIDEHAPACVLNSFFLRDGRRRPLQVTM